MRKKQNKSRYMFMSMGEKIMLSKINPKKYIWWNTKINMTQ